MSPRAEMPGEKHEDCQQKDGGKSCGTHQHYHGIELLSDSQKLALRERIRHFTWTWFTMTMATGGIANVL